MFISKKKLKIISTALYLGKTQCSINGDEDDYIKISKCLNLVHKYIDRKNIFIRIGKAIWFTLIDIDGKYKNKGK